MSKSPIHIKEVVLPLLYKMSVKCPTLSQEMFFLF